METRDARSARLQAPGARRARFPTASPRGARISLQDFPEAADLGRRGSEDSDERAGRLGGVGATSGGALSAGPLGPAPAPARSDVGAGLSPLDPSERAPYDGRARRPGLAPLEARSGAVGAEASASPKQSGWSPLELEAAEIAFRTGAELVLDCSPRAPQCPVSGSSGGLQHSTRESGAQKRVNEATQCATDRGSERDGEDSTRWAQNTFLWLGGLALLVPYLALVWLLSWAQRRRSS